MNTQPIKIAFVIDSLALGGAERILLDLLKNLAKEDFSCRVYTIIEQGVLAQECELLGIPVHNIGKRGKWSWCTVTGLRQAWRVWRPDVVHTHLFAGDTYGRLAAWLEHIPVISTEHNMNLDEGGMKKYIRWMLSHVTEKIIAVSQAVKNYSVKEEHISEQKVSVIYNGVDSNRFSPQKNKVHSVVPVIGMTSRLHPNKGHAYLFQALALLPDEQFSVLIVGAGSEQKKLQEMTGLLRIKQHIQFKGAVKDVVTELSQMDIVILPSVQEGFGLSAVEAMCMEKVVVAFETGPLAEIIQDGVTGRLVPQKDVRALSLVLAELIHNEHVRSELGQAARTYALTHFSLEQMVKAYTSIYLELTKKP